MLLVWHKLGKTDLTYSCMRSHNPCTCFVLWFGSSDLSCATGRLQCFMTVEVLGFVEQTLLAIEDQSCFSLHLATYLCAWVNSGLWSQLPCMIFKWLIVYTDSSQYDYLQVDCIVCDGNCSCKSSLELAGCETQAVGDAKSNWWQSNWWDVCKIQHWKNVSILISLSLEC